MCIICVINYFDYYLIHRFLLTFKNPLLLLTVNMVLKKKFYARVCKYKIKMDKIVLLVDFYLLSLYNVFSF